MISKNLRQGERVLQLLQDRYPEYHPLIGVAKIAHTTDDDRLEFDCHKVLCEYVEPKLKSVEVQQTLPEDAALRVIFEGDFEELPSPTSNGTAALESKEESPVDKLMSLDHEDETHVRLITNEV
jgi:hypothetical protein